MWYGFTYMFLQFIFVSKGADEIIEPDTEEGKLTDEFWTHESSKGAQFVVIVVFLFVLLLILANYL